MIYKKFIKPALFLLSPESAHHLVSGLIRFLFMIPTVKWFVKKIFVVCDKKLERTVFGITFPNPVGLAAGFDKDAKMFDELSCLGFGFIEIGTVTPVAQDGNPTPRMFRLTNDDGLINRMGFNNEGVTAAARRLRNRKSKIIIGGNIGKNKVTPNESAINDYEKCFMELFDVVDYFVINVSSPNTPGLRELQEKEPLKKLLNHLKELNRNLSSDTKKAKPMLLKIAPDLTDEQLDDIIEIVAETNIDGVVATNTTVSRNNLSISSQELDEIGAGGLSGKPLAERSTEVIRYLAKKSMGKFSIIGVGGIHSSNDAIEKLNAGASLVQVYTGFIYEGPGLVKRINNSLLNL